MERDYSNGVKNNVVFFTGIEVEKTPAYGLKTLFVVGIKPIEDIITHGYKQQCDHIYLGANQSFTPDEGFGESFFTYAEWERMVSVILSYKRWKVTLDFDVKYAEWVSNQGFVKDNLFIPQISVKIPNIRNFNYNTMVKVDDIDFNATNPGVWCHRLHNLQDDEKFTDWSKYSKDDPL
ncbi:MAG: hypothetical protein K2X74_22975 [Acetobacteraceae bacterium]|nr:hypothetical protein [Acetobacteraceae bacterium]